MTAPRVYHLEKTGALLVRTNEFDETNPIPAGGWREESNCRFDETKPIGRSVIREDRSTSSGACCQGGLEVVEGIENISEFIWDKEGSAAAGYLRE
jgi:hypothetical protein